MSIILTNTPMPERLASLYTVAPENQFNDYAEFMLYLWEAMATNRRDFANVDVQEPEAGEWMLKHLSAPTPQSYTMAANLIESLVRKYVLFNKGEEKAIEVIQTTMWFLFSKGQYATAVRFLDLTLGISHYNLPLVNQVCTEAISAGENDQALEICNLILDLSPGVGYHEDIVQRIREDRPLFDQPTIDLWKGRRDHILNLLSNKELIAEA